MPQAGQDPQTGQGPNADIELPPPGGWLSEIPLSQWWIARQLTEATTGHEYEDVLVPAVVDTVVDPLVEAAGEQIGTAIVVAGAVAVVSVLGLGTLALVAWKTK